MVAGNRITINRSNGEVFTFAWSVFEDTLTFRASAVAGDVSPAPWVAKPFRRTGG